MRHLTLTNCSRLPISVFCHSAALTWTTVQNNVILFCDIAWISPKIYWWSYIIWYLFMLFSYLSVYTRRKIRLCLALCCICCGWMPANFTHTLTRHFASASVVSLKIMIKCNTWWRHQIEAFSALLVFCTGNSTVTGEFPAQRSVTRSLDIFLICTWIYGWVNNGEAGDLRRHRAHHGVIVMHESSWSQKYNLRKQTTTKPCV